MTYIFAKTGDDKKPTSICDEICNNDPCSVTETLQIICDGDERRADNGYLKIWEEDGERHPDRDVSLFVFFQDI